MTTRIHIPSHNKQVDAYTSDRRLKQHEIELLDIVQDHVGDVSDKLDSLDIGCADGLFLRNFKMRFPQWNVEGVEVNGELINQGASENAAYNIKVHKDDAYRFVPSKKYDLITASGIIAVFDDPLPVLDRWIDWLHPGGTLFVFSTFNTGDIDTRVSFRNNFSSNGWETGLTGYSINTIKRYLEKQDISAEFLPFELSEDLLKDENPIRSYTVKAEDGKRFVIAGNILCEFHHLIIKRPL